MLSFISLCESGVQMLTRSSFTQKSCLHKSRHGYELVFDLVLVQKLVTVCLNCLFGLCVFHCLVAVNSLLRAWDPVVV